MKKTLCYALLLASLPLSAQKLNKTLYADQSTTASPAVIAASPYGDVFVGIDLQGSLGKKINMGKIKRLRDNNNDGVADEITDYVTIDNPRGIVSIGNRLIVLHCTQKDGKVYGQAITEFIDANNDGVADGPGKVLVKGIGNPKFVQSRGADHCTNNIRLGVDGWLYISVGDFGFVDAEGTDGKKLTFYGGGIARVRPDGSELEMFVHGTRNVYDVAIDPFMNVFSRENTNDGVGWWVRFSHYIQSGEYGYPCLYKNFIDEMIPALGMYGSGSGTGALFLQEPGWPKEFNNKPLMADWGRSQIYIHEVTPDGPSFTNVPKDFLKVSQVADLDVDASGRMYVAAWAGAGYKGNGTKGYVERYVPENWQYKAFPDLTKLSKDQLLNVLNSESATARVYAQQEILRRADKSMSKHLISLCQSANSLESRVAALYTLAQLIEVQAFPILEKLATDPDLREHAIRLLGDRKVFNQQANVKFISQYLKDKNPRVAVAASVALGRLGKQSAANELMALALPPQEQEVKIEKVKVRQSASAKVTFKNSVTDINVDISQYKSLSLIVDSQGSNGGDHAAWVNPVIILKNGKSIDLTNLKWKKAKGGWGKTLVNKDCRGKELKNLKGEKLKGIGTHAASTISYKLPKGAKSFKAKGMISSGAHEQASIKFIVSEEQMAASKDGPTKCSTPNPAIIIPHVARQALVSLKAHDAVIKALNSSDKNQQKAALNTMKFMHDKEIIDALEARLSHADKGLQAQIYSVLMRLQQKDVDWDGSTWWSTRPSPQGPYFEPTSWEQSERIATLLKTYLTSLSADEQKLARQELDKNRCNLDGKKKVVAQKPKSPGDIKVGKSAIEDVLVYLGKHKGNAKRGKEIIKTVGCIGCHNIEVGMVVKGPDLSKLGKMTKSAIAESIIKPGATIAKSWVTVHLKDGSSSIGTLIKDDKKEITVHNITGLAIKIQKSKIKKMEPGLNMMSLHLTDGLSLKQFADLVEYIQSMDSRK
jgi:putative heme-binding domain-containing protein